MQDLSTLRAGAIIKVGLGESKVRPSMDFETYSAAGFKRVPNLPSETNRWQAPYKIKGTGNGGKGGLPVVGTPNYVEHDSAEAICLYYDLKDGRGRIRWLPHEPSPVSLLDHILEGGEIEAFNITFEWWVWNMVCTRLYGWPSLPLEQCVCVMAKSRRYSLPGALANCAKVLGVTDKDKAGKNLIQKLTRPHTPTKNRPADRHTTATAWPDFLAMYGYCDTDVQVEDECAALIPDLTEYERSTWLLDQVVNVRGVQVDVAALDAALSILAQTEEKYTLELQQITGGEVGTVNENEKFRDWLARNGAPLPNMQKETIDEALEDFDEQYSAAPHGTPINLTHRALQIRGLLGSANVKKLRTLKLQVSSDGRLRNQYTYCGADRTGRASAGGVQLQNITAKGPTTAKCSAHTCGKYFGIHLDVCPHCDCWMVEVAPEWTVDAVQDAIADILTGDLALVEHRWGSPIDVLCGCLRGLFIAKKGHDFICVDYSAIEAVVAACLSRCQWRIEIFGGHGKIYEQSAANATGISFEEILAYKKEHGMHHKARKTIGKVRELAGGYGGWIGAWKNFGADDFMTDEEIKIDVLKWRDESPEIVEMWGGQYRETAPGSWRWVPELYGLEGMAILAIQNPGQCFSHIDITYGVFNDVLYCRLPSGRFLHYHRPRLAPVRDKLGRDEKTGTQALQITFEGYNSNATKGAIGWFRLETYGGRLFENVVQAVAADIQFDGLKRVEAAGYPIVMHTHDEGVAEVPLGTKSIQEMESVMSERPSWASWWPIKAAGWRHKRYQKD